MARLDPSFIKNKQHKLWVTQLNDWVVHPVKILRLSPEIFNFLREELGYPETLKEFHYRGVPVIKIERKK